MASEPLPHPNAHPLRPSLDQAYVTAVLQSTQVRALQHDTFGGGYMLLVGEGEASAVLDVFPGARRLKVYSGACEVWADGIGRVSQRGDRLRVESFYDSEQLVVEISADGHFGLTRRPRRGNEGELLDAPGAAGAGEEAANRVTLRGRLGADPRFRDTARRGERVCSFPLGVHPDLETTVWYPIVVFGERARKLEAKGLHKGQEVEVVGYVHERIGLTKDGGGRLITQVYAAAVRTSLSTAATPEAQPTPEA